MFDDPDINDQHDSHIIAWYWYLIDMKMEEETNRV